MPIVQQATGTFNGNGTFTPTLPAASSAANRVVVILAGNATVATPAGWTLRTSKVNYMGHYLFDRPGGSASYNFTINGLVTWWIGEVQAGVYVTANSQETAGSPGTSYTTPAITPTAGTRILLASLASIRWWEDPATLRTVSGWTNSFTELADFGAATGDYPAQAVASREVAADGSTGYSTGGTFSVRGDGRSAIIGAYETSSAPQPPTVNPVSAQTIDPHVNDQVTVTATASGSPSSWTWTQLSGPTVTLTGTGATRTFTAPAVFGATSGTVVLGVTATNANGTSPQVQVTRTILPTLHATRIPGGDWVRATPTT